jgi:hypothetical protein
LLQSGGELTSTTQRLRKGVPIFDQYGKSIGDTPESDVRSGGAITAFTRLRPARDASSIQGIFFKIRNMRRADMVHYNRDEYGRLSLRGNKGVNAFDFTQHAEAAEWMGNEVLFKHGISLLDEIDVIRVYTKKERNETIKAFKRNGVDVLPDGRKVEDIVLREGQGFLNADRNYDAYDIEERGGAESISKPKGS